MADETPRRGITDKELDQFEDHYKPIEEETAGRAEPLGAQAATVLLLVEILRQGRGMKPPKDEPEPKPAPTAAEEEEESDIKKILKKK